MIRHRAHWRARSAVTGILLFLLTVMIVRDVFANRRSARSLPS
jgi:hypothetical protein